MIILATRGSLNHLQFLRLPIILPRKPRKELGCKPFFLEEPWPHCELQHLCSQLNTRWPEDPKEFSQCTSIRYRGFFKLSELNPFGPVKNLPETVKSQQRVSCIVQLKSCLKMDSTHERTLWARTHGGVRNPGEAFSCAK